MNVRKTNTITTDNSRKGEIITIYITIVKQTLPPKITPAQPAPTKIKQMTQETAPLQTTLQQQLHHYNA